MAGKAACLTYSSIAFDCNSPQGRKEGCLLCVNWSMGHYHWVSILPTHWLATPDRVFPTFLPPILVGSVFQNWDTSEKWAGPRNCAVVPQLSNPHCTLMIGINVPPSLKMCCLNISLISKLGSISFSLNKWARFHCTKNCSRATTQ